MLVTPNSNQAVRRPITPYCRRKAKAATAETCHDFVPAKSRPRPGRRRFRIPHSAFLIHDRREHGVVSQFLAAVQEGQFDHKENGHHGGSALLHQLGRRLGRATGGE